jgi:hypothetical protein
MKRLLIVLVLVGAGIVGLGFYRGWFHIRSEKTDDKSDVTLSVDKDKIQEDRKTVVSEVHDLKNRIQDKVAGPSEKTMDGTVVSVSADKLTMANKKGKEHSHALAANVTVICDRKACKPADLEAGMRIRVTTEDAPAHAVSRIEALDKDVAFATSSYDGKVVSITDKKLVMTNREGKGEQTCTLSADARVTCDGTLCKASDLKPGMRIRVTSEGADANVATRIEALDKNPDFEKGA